MSPMPVRTKSPSALIRDKFLARYQTDEVTSSPTEAKYPARMVSTIMDRAGISRGRAYRWLADPDRHPLDWSELCELAEEAGGTLRCMFSVKHR